MSRVAVIGETVRAEGFALAGALVIAAEDQDAARAAWRSLPTDIAVVVLTAQAAAWLGEPPQPPRDVLLAVMPS
jgi:vacuolar-type H+-ATPase subunit F/Vma7